MAPKVLVVLTSFDTMPATGKPTGWFLVSEIPHHTSLNTTSLDKHTWKNHSNKIKTQPEFAHPYYELEGKCDLTIASPKGGEAPLDPSSVEMFKSDPKSTQFLESPETQKLWKNTEKLSNLLPRVSEFDAIFYVGGHGRKSSPFPGGPASLVTGSPPQLSRDKAIQN